MGCCRRLLTAMVLALAILAVGVCGARFRNHTPDPRTLLDLDLFTPDSLGETGSDQNSMLEQIRTLRAMGYLNRNVSPPAINQLLPPANDTEDGVTQ